jgi:hypothetical protein
VAEHRNQLLAESKHAGLACRIIGIQLGWWVNDHAIRLSVLSMMRRIPSYRDVIPVDFDDAVGG